MAVAETVQEVRWLGFGLANTLSKTCAHFFPSEGNVTAPYLSNCELRVFGGDFGATSKAVLLEGARLSHPDGVRLEDAFSALNGDNPVAFGLMVTLVTAQPRVDISGSRCIIEVASNSFSARFYPRMLSYRRIATTSAEVAAESKDNAGRSVSRTISRSVALIRDSFSNCTLICINHDAHPVKAQLATTNRQGQLQGIDLPPLAPLSFVEHSFDEQFFDDAVVSECSWGLVRSKPLYVTYQEQQQLSYYLVYRDVVTRRPISICAL